MLPTPAYMTWDEYLGRTTETERLAWCARKAKVANRYPGRPGRGGGRVSADQVWAIMSAAKGRCCYCGSLAVEGRPSNPATGGPAPWAPVGRRIGSLEHVDQQAGDARNAPANLAWACLWCNTWNAQDERTPGALDHGAIQA
jgi:hypothetical protein